MSPMVATSFNVTGIRCGQISDSEISILSVYFLQRRRTPGFCNRHYPDAHEIAVGGKNDPTQTLTPASNRVCSGHLVLLQVLAKQHIQFSMSFGVGDNFFVGSQYIFCDFIKMNIPCSTTSTPNIHMRITPRQIT